MPFIQPLISPTPAGINLSGKTVIVTGASAGIGLETSRQFLQLGVTNLYMCVRNISKGEGVKTLLLSDPFIQKQNPGANIQVLKLDMDFYTSVKDFCTLVKKEIPVIDILVLNAGTGNTVYETSATGHERTFQVNYLSNALLVFSLLPLLLSSGEKNGTPSRITWVGSRMQYRSTFISKPIPASQSVFAYLDDKKNYGLLSYANTKYLAYNFMLEIMRRVPKEKLLFNILCPGMVYSDMANNLSFVVRTLTKAIFSVRGRSTEVAGWVVINAAAVVGMESNGRFLLDKEIQEPMDFVETSQGQELKDKIWKETVAEIGKYTSVPDVLSS